MGNTKELNTYVMRTKTVEGLPAKTTFCIYENGVILIVKVCLATDIDNKRHDLLCVKFGKALYRTVVSFKYSSLYDILHTASSELRENKIPKNKIL